MKTNENRFLFRLLIFLIIYSNLTIAQPGIKAGLVLSGFQPRQDLSPFLGNDYRPFLGYEVDWIQDEAHPKVGFQAGVFYTKDLSKHFAIQPELYYSQRGLHFYQTELYNISYSLNVSYLEIPLLLKYKFPVGWRIRPGLIAGPYAAFKLSANRTIDIWGERDTKSVTCVNNLDYGIVFGINSEFSAWSKQAIFELRFSWGLANIMKQPEEYTALFEDAGRVNVIAVTLMTGFRF